MEYVGGVKKEVGQPVEYKKYCLKVGNKYTNKHVYELADQVGDLIVITDDVTLGKDFTIIPVDDSLPIVWNKMRLFDTDQFPDEGIFFDLDIRILKDITNIFSPLEYMALLQTDWEDLEELKRITIGNLYGYCSINSSVMVWNKKTKRQHVWNQFQKDKSKALRLFDGIDKYLEHRHFKNLSFFETGLVGSYRCNPNADVHIMSYDGEGKEWL